MAGASTGVDVFGPDVTGGSGLSGQFFSGQFGDASDGDFTVVGTFSAPREMHYNNLTIPAGAILKPVGFRIFVAGTLTIAATGSLNDDGLNSTSQAGALGLGSRGYLSAASGQGGNGAALTSVIQSNGTTGSGASSCSLNNLGQAPTGGKGGDSSTRVGGAGGSAAIVSPSQKWNGRWIDGRGSNAAFNGGSGGGGGAGTVTAYTSGTFISGGAGSGGGIVWVAAKNIINNGRISANGGNGSNGSLGVGTGDCAGGGGGGGGNVTVITQTAFAALGTVQALGGLGGTGVANNGFTNNNGVNGNSGSVCIMVLS
jgi:hypothetical protein